MTQTLALLLDAYRELNAKKLFWITMILSGLVAACFFLIGINENGLKVIAWELDLPPFNTREMTAAAFYKMMFSGLAIRIWLGIAATVLAIISTASFFPDLCKEGSIDLMLSKPISRLRLFFTRYCTGLLFAFMQVFVFTFICFLVIGIRGGAWEPGLFLAVPFFVLFFSYLFAVSTLIGTLTRSTIAALLVTLLLFAMLIGINFTDEIARAEQFNLESAARLYEQRVEDLRTLDEDKLQEFELKSQTSLAEIEAGADRLRQSADSYGRFVHVMYLIKWPLPKTGETLALLSRTIIDAAELPQPDVKDPVDAALYERDSEIVRETMEDLERPVWWVVGTSLAFEFILVGFAAFVFCRRDY